MEDSALPHPPTPDRRRPHRLVPSRLRPPGRTALAALPLGLGLAVAVLALGSDAGPVDSPRAAGAPAPATVFSASARGFGAWNLVGARARARFMGRGPSAHLQLEDRRPPGRRTMVRRAVAPRATMRVTASLRPAALGLKRGGRRAMLAIVGGYGSAAHAGVVKTAAGPRLAVWASVRGKVNRVRLSTRRPALRRWQSMRLTTRWGRGGGRATLVLGGRVVATARLPALAIDVPAEVAVGLGGAKTATSGRMQIRRAKISGKGWAVGPGGRGRVGAPEDYPYDPRALFNRPIAPSAATDPRSAAVVQQLVENVSTVKATLSNSGEVPPVYVAKPSDPTYTVTVAGEDVEFRMPDGARAGGGADRPLVVLEPNHPTLGRHVELRLWQASVDEASRRISASGSGLFRYNNDGKEVNGQPANGLPFSGQGTGSELSILTGLIRPAEVRAGRIPHAVRFAYSRTDMVGGYRAPAVKTDQDAGARNPAGAMEMGMRLQLDRSVDCSTRTVPGEAANSGATRFLRTLCRALQDYGMVVLDGSSDRVLLVEMEDEATAGWSKILGAPRSNSYSHIIRDQSSPDDGLSRNASSGIPWNRMHVLARGE
jgi:hypothetical protein